MTIKRIEDRIMALQAYLWRRERNWTYKLIAQEFATTPSRAKDLTIKGEKIYFWRAEQYILALDKERSEELRQYVKDSGSARVPKKIRFEIVWQYIYELKKELETAKEFFEFLTVETKKAEQALEQLQNQKYAIQVQMMAEKQKLSKFKTIYTKRDYDREFPKGT